MNLKRNPPAWLVLALGVGGILLALWVAHIRRHVTSISGAVIRQDSDPRKEIPIAGVEVSAAGDLATRDDQSGASGLFRLPLRWGVEPGQTITLLFQHSGYQPLALTVKAGNQLYLARMAPIFLHVSDRPDVVIAHVDVRYSVQSAAVVNIGSVEKTFPVQNTGNVACHNQRPCSPDHKWKAAIGSLSLDAGPGSEFRDVRVSCIAGPCPFTRIEPPSYSHDGRQLTVSALNWSDTATFLVEAEVNRAAVSATSRVSYPVTFGEALSFTLPAGAEGVFVEAELNGSPIVFPLGPDLLLDWADCNARMNRDNTRSYQCTLKPGYRFGE